MIIMEQTTYDVFKGIPQKNPLCLGAIVGLKRATDLMNRMASRLPGDYFVFDTTSKEVVALAQNRSVSTQPPNRAGVPSQV